MDMLGELGDEQATPLRKYSGPPLVVPTAVFEGLEAVRRSGKASLLDRKMVQSWALRMGHVETVLWIEHHPDEYRYGVFRGFRAGGSA